MYLCDSFRIQLTSWLNIAWKRRGEENREGEMKEAIRLTSEIGVNRRLKEHWVMYDIEAKRQLNAKVVREVRFIRHEEVKRDQWIDDQLADRLSD